MRPRLYPSHGGPLGGKLEKLSNLTRRWLAAQLFALLARRASRDPSSGVEIAHLPCTGVVFGFVFEGTSGGGSEVPSKVAP
jgi:hypothetical protein